MSAAASGTLSDALSAWGPAPRRHEIVNGPGHTTHYGPWRIYFDPPPIPTRSCDWHFHHVDYDGAEDSNDRRAGHAGSFAEALNECNEMEDDA